MACQSMEQRWRKWGHLCLFQLTLDIQGDEPLVDQRGVGVVDPAAQQLSVVHGPGCEGEGVGEDRRVALLQVVR